MTDDGLAALSHDTLMERLYCFKPKITDAGVKHLANLTNLKKLELLRVPELTDATLAHIAGLTNLEEDQPFRHENHRIGVGTPRRDEKAEVTDHSEHGS